MPRLSAVGIVALVALVASCAANDVNPSSPVLGSIEESKAAQWGQLLQDVQSFVQKEYLAYLEEWKGVNTFVFPNIEGGEALDFFKDEGEADRNDYILILRWLASDSGTKENWNFEDLYKVRQNTDGSFEMLFPDLTTSSGTPPRVPSSHIANVVALEKVLAVVDDRAEATSAPDTTVELLQEDVDEASQVHCEWFNEAWVPKMFGDVGHEHCLADKEAGAAPLREAMDYHIRRIPKALKESILKVKVAAQKAAAEKGSDVKGEAHDEYIESLFTMVFPNIYVAYVNAFRDAGCPCSIRPWFEFENAIVQANFGVGSIAGMCDCLNGISRQESVQHLREGGMGALTKLGQYLLSEKDVRDANAVDNAAVDATIDGGGGVSGDAANTVDNAAVDATIDGGSGVSGDAANTVDNTAVDATIDGGSGGSGSGGSGGSATNLAAEVDGSKDKANPNSVEESGISDTSIASADKKSTTTDAPVEGGGGPAVSPPKSGENGPDNTNKDGKTPAPESAPASSSATTPTSPMEEMGGPAVDALTKTADLTNKDKPLDGDDGYNVDQGSISEGDTSVDTDMINSQANG